MWHLSSHVLDELDLEADNIRVALRHCLADPDGADLGLTMAAGLGQYWRHRAVSEGVYWIDALLARRGGDEAIRSHALYVKITLAVVQGDHAAGLEAVAEATAIARRLKDDGLLVRILANQAALEVLAGDLSAARATSADATALAARLGDDMSFIAAAQSEAFVAFVDADFTRMRDVGLAAAARSRQCNEIFMLSVHLTSAGMGALMLGDHAAAEAALIEALDATLVVDDRPGLGDANGSARKRRRDGEAARSVQQSCWVRRRCCVEPSAPSRARSRCPWSQRLENSPSAVLGEARYNKAFEAGANLDREGAVGLALGKKVARDAEARDRQEARSARQT